MNWRVFQQEYRDHIDLIKRLQLIPGFGAIVDAYANYNLMDQLAETAMNVYHMRILKEKFSILDRLSDWTYPILYYDHQQIVQVADYSGHTVSGLDIGFHFLPLGEYVFHSFGLLVCLSMFIVTVGIFLSIFIRKPVAVFTTTIVIFGLGYSTAQYAPMMAHLLPFAYFDIKKIVNDELTILSDNPTLTTNMGVIVLLISSFLLLLLGWGIFKVQAILKA